MDGNIMCYSISCLEIYWYVSEMVIQPSPVLVEVLIISDIELLEAERVGLKRLVKFFSDLLYWLTDIT